MRVPRLPTLIICLLTCVACAPALFAAENLTLDEADMIIQSNLDNTRVLIRLDEKVNIRVVNMMDRPQNYFYVDIYGVKPSFSPMRLFRPQETDYSLKAVQTMWYEDAGVLRVIFLPKRKTRFRVVDPDTMHVYESSPAQGPTPSQPKAKYLLIDTAATETTALPPPLDRRTLSQEGDPAQPTPMSGPLTKRLIVLDPGHGGKSMGAVSRSKVNGAILREKDIVLVIAKEVQRLLNKTPVATTVLTRQGDEYKSLADRVAMTEKLEADLFVSIHANAARYHRKNHAPRGVEFYYLSPSSNPDVRQLELLENDELGEVLDPQASAQLQLITQNMAKDILNELRADSSEVAGALDSVFRQDSYYKRFNRGVKSAAFKVLRNQVSPAVLVEVGFIDHDKEARNLANPAFQKRIAMLITNGILEYISVLDSRVQPYQYQMAY